MRGKGLLQIFISEPLGITPAYAGKRPGNVSGAHNVWDHPRVCGEKRRSSWCRPCSGGSPPRMRGKVRHADSWCLTFGITPAYAGKRSTSCPSLRHHRDHPRVCGEKPRYASEPFLPQGSPPRMRGKEASRKLRGTLKGITPAYAGKSYDHMTHTPQFWDHPRVCGEKSPLPDPERIFQGSPPRMRGKGHVFFQLFPAHRITPAYAGKRNELQAVAADPEDHPRVCGEKPVSSCGIC